MVIERKVPYGLILPLNGTDMEMVLKEVAMYKIVNNFGNNGWIWLKF